MGVVDERLGVVAADPAARGLLLGVAHRPRLGEAVVGDVRELGHPAAHVGAVGVELLLLGHRVEQALEVGRGVGARRGDPLPAAVVGADVAVDQVLHEVRLARAPVLAEVLGQERADDHARAVVHPAAGQQLAHRGVDDREAGRPSFHARSCSASWSHSSVR